MLELCVVSVDKLLTLFHNPNKLLSATISGSGQGIIAADFCQLVCQIDSLHCTSHGMSASVRAEKVRQLGSVHGDYSYTCLGEN